MDSVDVSTVVYLPPEEIYEFLIDFPGYANYSQYLTDVVQRGDGSPGTRYDMRFAWWKLSYVARSEVTAVERPYTIDWQLVKDIDAEGRWLIEEAPDASADGPACRVHLQVEFDPDSARGAAGLPAFVSFDWLVGKVRPKILGEAERIVERIVADLEGQQRQVQLTVHEGPSSI